MIRSFIFPHLSRCGIAPLCLAIALTFTACSNSQSVSSSPNTPVNPVATRRVLPSLISLDGKTSATALEYPTIVHFFASWCSTCKEEMLALQELSRRGERAGFRVLFIAVEDARPPLQALAAQYQFPIYLDEGGRWKEQFQVTSLPKTVLLNRYHELIPIRDPQTGDLVQAILGPREWHGEATLTFLENLK